MSSGSVRKGHMLTLKWVGGSGGYLSLLDQTLLPARVKYLRIRELSVVIDAIRAWRYAELRRSESRRLMGSSSA